MGIYALLQCMLSSHLIFEKAHGVFFCTFARNTCGANSSITYLHNRSMWDIINFILCNSFFELWYQTFYVTPSISLLLSSLEKKREKPLCPKNVLSALLEALKWYFYSGYHSWVRRREVQREKCVCTVLCSGSCTRQTQGRYGDGKKGLCTESKKGAQRTHIWNDEDKGFGKWWQDVHLAYTVFTFSALKTCFKWCCKVYSLAFNPQRCCLELLPWWYYISVCTSIAGNESPPRCKVQPKWPTRSFRSSPNRPLNVWTNQCSGLEIKQRKTMVEEKNKCKSPYQLILSYCSLCSCLKIIFHSTRDLKSIAFIRRTPWGR